MNARQLRVFLERMHGCLRSSAQVKASFEPELEACAAIMAIFEERGVDGDSLRAAVAVLNRVSAASHYNGSVWFDLQNQIVVTCCEHGVPARVGPGGTLEADAGIVIDEA